MFGPLKLPLKAPKKHSLVVQMIHLFHGLKLLSGQPVPPEMGNYHFGICGQMEFARLFFMFFFLLGHREERCPKIFPTDPQIEFRVQSW